MSAEICEVLCPQSHIRGTTPSCKRARELTFSHYTKRQITEQLIFQSHGSMYGVGP